MHHNLSLKYFLYDHPGAKMPKLYLRITVNRKKVELALDHFLPHDEWDEKMQRSFKNKKLNEELKFIESKISEIKRNLIYQGKEVTAQLLKDFFLGKAEKKYGLVEYYQEFNHRIEKLPNQYSKVLISKYKNNLQRIKDFLATKKLKDILIKDVNYKWLAEFDYYMLTTPTKQYKVPLGRNTANKQHDWLRSILIKAWKEDHISKNPYLDFKLKDEKTTREHLTQQEVDLLIKHELSGNESLKRVRDMFLFSVYTGLRFSDAISLKTEHIKQSPDGKYWIDKKQKKTGEQVLVPMLKHAVNIYHKYDNQERQIMGYILPRLSNQKLNSYLKTIAELTDINKKLTHHVARHTFATTITLSNEVPLEVVSKWLGHTDLETTQIYAKITQQYASNLVDKLEGKL
jgi:site-specific recombinase XerD